MRSIDRFLEARCSFAFFCAAMETKTTPKKTKKQENDDPGGVDEEWPWMNDGGSSSRIFHRLSATYRPTPAMCDSICCVQLTLKIYTIAA